MPSFEISQPPVVAAHGDAEALRQYIVLLVDRLKYVLNHLDDENITGISATKIGRQMGRMAEALGEKGTDNERVRQMVRELTMTAMRSATVNWHELKGFDTAVNGLSAGLRDELVLVNRGLDRAEAEQLKQSADISALQGELDRLAELIGDAADRIDDAESRLDALEADMEDLTARVEALENPEDDPPEGGDDPPENPTPTASALNMTKLKGRGTEYV